MSVFIGSIPNAQEDDISLAKAILNSKVDENRSINILKSKFNEEIFLFNKGRDSLYFFLKLLNLKKEDEVITQAFTCVAVASPILWCGVKPVYVDIDLETLNMDSNLLRKKITKKTRAVIVQHTFGNMANVEKVREIVDEINSKRELERKIYIIEDCAHLFVKDFSTLNIGKYSDAYFFSFSQDKSISCTQGAMLIINDRKILGSAKLDYDSISILSKNESIYNARYIYLWSLIKRYYFTTIIPFTNITFGRILIMLFRLLGLIKRQASFDTLQFDKIAKISEVQACLLLIQLEKVEDLNNHRKSIVNIYNGGLRNEFRFNSNRNALLRYPIFVFNRDLIKKKLLAEKIIVGNWYSTPIFPLTGNLEKVTYELGSCKNAELAGKYIINLPINIEVTQNDANRIVEIINVFAKPVKF